jgi:lauroyl/myristoyl acyltransferase
VLVACSESPYHLERSVLAGKYEEILQMLREHRPGGWSGSIRALGFEHLERALASKRGAVLWVAPCNFAELNVKKALHAAGYRVSNLRSHIHPYSGTRFGRAILNPVRTSVEDRLLASTVVLRPGNAATVLRELQHRLRENGLVYITANSAGDRPCRLPFLDGTLSLALGAAALARIAKAPLLPVFASPARAGVYEVEVQAALEPAEGLVARRHDEHLAAAYAARLEAFVKRHPTAWPGWFNRRQWEPPRVTARS